MLKTVIGWFRKKDPEPTSYRDRRSMWITIDLAQKKVRQNYQTKNKR